MTGILICAAVIAAGILLLIFGPVGWRTHIMGGVVAAFPVVGEILNFANGFQWSSVLTAENAMWAMGGCGVLVILYNAVNKKLYGSVPKQAG